MTASRFKSRNAPPIDQAHETIAQVIGGLVDMMEHGRLPAVDFADLKTMFERNSDGTARVWYVGQGSAGGPDRAAQAAQVAAAALSKKPGQD